MTSVAALALLDIVASLARFLGTVREL